MADSSTFLALPSEILQMILRELLVAIQPLHMTLREPRPGPRQLFPEVLLTCRKIYNEGITLLYGQNIFHVPLMDKWRLQTPTSERNIILIQRVVIRLYTYKDTPLEIKIDYPQGAPARYSSIPFRLMRPMGFFVANVQRDLPATRYFDLLHHLRGYDRLHRVETLLQELWGSVGEPLPGGRPLTQKRALKQEMLHALHGIEYCKDNRITLAVVAAVRPTISTLDSIDLTGSPRPPPNAIQVLLFLSTSTPVHASHLESPALVSHARKEHDREPLI